MLRKICTALLSVTLLTMGAAVPFMEGADLVHEPAVESEHHPSTCPPTHDHTICTQVGANFSATTPAPVPCLAPAELAVRPLDRSAARVPSLLDDGHRSRAPPTA